MNTLAPILLFVYNRPQHTRKCLQSLSQNVLASESELIIYSDGCKSEKDKDKVLATRLCVNEFKSSNLFKSIQIIEREQNIGLANNVIGGVTEVINRYGKVIVLEDDLISSPHFLSFMNDALNLYENTPNVGMIHGHFFDIPNLPDNFFLQKAGSWGWGTWKNIWNGINFDSNELLTNIQRRSKEKEFDIDGTYSFTQLLKKQGEGKVNSWAIRVYAHLFLNGLLSFYPGKSLIKNIGFDSGTHYKAGNIENDKIAGKLSAEKIEIQKIEVQNNRQVQNLLEAFYRSQKKNIIIKGYLKVRSLLRIFPTKKK